MKCPFCNCLDTYVKNSRPMAGATSVKRRRACVNCGAKFTTLEKVELKSIIVLKSDGSKAVFDQEKMKRSMQMAICKNTHLPKVIDSVIEVIVQKFRKRPEGIVTTAEIGQIVMDELSKIDQAAYLRYASMHLDFTSAKDFIDMIQKLDSLA